MAIDCHFLENLLITLIKKYCLLFRTLTYLAHWSEDLNLESQRM